jgi:phenylalanyl-tRNA synthetase alpha chain
MDPLERLEESRLEATAAVAGADTLATLDEVEQTLLGKDSTVGEVRRSMGRLDPEQRPRVGARLHEVTAEITRLLAGRRQALEVVEANARLESERLDVSLPAVTYPVGYLHLIQQTIDEIVDIFTAIGYQVTDGPEAELGWYNFDALNTPPPIPHGSNPTPCTWITEIPPTSCCCAPRPRPSRRGGWSRTSRRST